MPDTPRTLTHEEKGGKKLIEAITTRMGESDWGVGESFNDKSNPRHMTGMIPEKLKIEDEFRFPV